MFYRLAPLRCYREEALLRAFFEFNGVHFIDESGVSRMSGFRAESRQSIKRVLCGGVAGLLFLGALPEVARANDNSLNQLMSQVAMNNSWAEASFPVENFQGYALLYGASRIINGAPDFNRGIDMTVAQGSFARSWLTGRIDSLSKNSHCGVAVSIQSGPWRHTYCQLEGQVVADPNSGKRMLLDAQGQTVLREGQVVGVGDRLGRVNRDSESGQWHLRWEVQYESRWIDPAIVLDMMYSQQQSKPRFNPVPDTNSTTVASSASKVVVALRRAIIGQESANNFRAVNPHSGALGYGQVMPFNVRRWSKEALGYSITPNEFLSSADLQLKIIEHKLSQYWRNALRLSGGNEEIAVRMVASQWYSGDPTLYDKANPQSYRGHRYPSIQSYTISVLSKYRVYRSMN